MSSKTEIPNFQIIENVNITLRAELDRRTIGFSELMELEVDSVLPLTRPTGENVDIYAGKILLGSGEILVIDSTLSVRVADIRDKLKGRAAETAEQS
jgi:flagellar motor switch/type III secretory pathway protein FliN